MVWRYAVYGMSVQWWGWGWGCGDDMTIKLIQEHKFLNMINTDDYNYTLHAAERDEN